ncbi:MAG: tetratricopeptide repeat protein [Phycisphaerales bacterium]|nr:tetratricopeptide repeat protein [Phycisphaerales bacterium]
MNDWSEAESFVERAHELYEAGRWAEAEAALRRALALNPYRAEWHFNLGLTLEAAGRWDEAERALKQAHELDGNDDQIMLMLGMTCLRAGRANDALSWLERAARMNPDRIDAYVHQIEAFAALKRWDEAEQAFYMAMQLDGGHAGAFANMGEAQLLRGDTRRAIACLREAAQREPTLPRVHARLASAYADAGRPARALELYVRQLREDPGDVDTLLDLACLLIDMNRLGEAHERLRRVLELDPNESDAHFYMGEIAMRCGRIAEAEGAYRVARKLDPEHPDVCRRLARVALQRGEVGEARRLLRREAKRAADNDLPPEEYAALVSMMVEARLAKDAVHVASDFVKGNETDAGAWQLFSMALLNTGDVRQGVIAAREVIRLNPGHTGALHNLALASIRTQHFARAGVFIARLAKANSDDPALRRLRWMRFIGRARRLMGRRLKG